MTTTTKIDPTITVMMAKIHEARVTDAKLKYKGSITIDPLLLEASGIRVHQQVHVNSLRDGTHWETYVIEGKKGDGGICLNGPPAHLFKPGDVIVIVAYATIKLSEHPLSATVVHVDKENRIISVQHS